MDKTASNPAREHIALQAEQAIANQQWSRLRFIGNRFERARCYKDCWFALAQASEATTHHQPPIWPGPDVSCKPEPTRKLSAVIRITSSTQSEPTTVENMETEAPNPLKFLVFVEPAPIETGTLAGVPT